MNGFSREAFFAWWQKETVDRIGFVDQEHAAYHAWAAAVDWYARQQRLLDDLADPDPDPCKDGFCPVELFRPIDETEGSV